MRTLKVTHDLISRVNDYQFYDIDLLKLFFLHISTKAVSRYYITFHLISRNIK